MLRQLIDDLAASMACDKGLLEAAIFRPQTAITSTCSTQPRPHGIARKQPRFSRCQQEICLAATDTFLVSTVISWSLSRWQRQIHHGFHRQSSVSIGLFREWLAAHVQPLKNG